jgi:hypothetical protein
MSATMVSAVLAILSVARAEPCRKLRLLNFELTVVWLSPESNYYRAERETTTELSGEPESNCNTLW